MLEATRTEVGQSSTPVDLYQTTGSSPPVSADEAHAIGQAIAAGADHLWQLLKRAEAGRVWEPLGLPDLPAFVAQYVPAEQRRPLVAELRSEGMSTRAIATATGVSQRTIVKDLGKVSPGTHVTPDAPVLLNFDPPKVTGIDGKTYKATRPKASKPKTPRQPTKAERSAHLADLAARVRANMPEALRETARQAALAYVKADGWHRFLSLVDDLSEECGTNS